MPRRATLVDFSEIFEHAEKQFGVHWNNCCDIFHRGRIIITDDDHNVEFTLEELQNDLKYDAENPTRSSAYSKDEKLAYEILVDFMKANELSEMYVTND